MDKSGTLPIFLYNNTQEESCDPVVDPSYQDTGDLLMDEHLDDIPVVSAHSSSTRSGRIRRAPNPVKTWFYTSTTQVFLQ